MTEEILDKLIHDWVSRCEQYGGGIPHDLEVRRIGRDQTGTIAFPEQAKVAALLYDRIWVPPRSYQKDFGFDFGDDQPPKAVQFFSREDVDDLNTVGSFILYADNSQQIADKMIEKIDCISARYQKKCKFRRTLRCGKDLKNLESKKGRAAFRAVIKNVQVPVNDRLQWDQILEMRKDKKSLANLRSMRVWIMNSLKSKGESEAQDILEEKLELYQEALDKHGAYTRNGTLAAVFTGVTGFAATPDEKGLILGFALLGGISLAIHKMRIDKKADLSGPGFREIAWLHALHRKPFMQRAKDLFVR